MTKSCYGDELTVESLIGRWRLVRGLGSDDVTVVDQIQEHLVSIDATPCPL
jgi:hypothetical protein